MKKNHIFNVPKCLGVRNCFLTSKSTMLMGSQLLYLDGCLLNDHSTVMLSRPISNASGSTRGPSHVKRTLYIPVPP